MIKILYCGSSSACFELDGGAPYYTKESYRVLVDGEEWLSAQKTNVFSLFRLRPGTGYAVAVRFEGGGEENAAAGRLDLPACLLVGAAAVLPPMFTRKFQRWQGAALLSLYAGYLYLTCQI